MKILQLTPEYPPFYCGGVGNSVYEVARRMQALGHKVEVIAPNGYGNKCEPKYEAHRLFALRIRRHWGEIAVCPTILREIKAVDFEVAHAHTPQKFFAESIYIFNLLAKRKKPYVVSIRLINRSLKPFLLSISDVYRKLVEKKIFKRASKIIVQSKANKAFMIRNCGAHPSKIAIVPNGVDTSFFNPKSIEDNQFEQNQKGDKTLLFAGRLTSQKGVDVLLNAFAEIRQKHHNLKLLIAGDGPLRSYLRNLSSILNLQAAVIFLGAVSHSEMPKLYFASDIFVLPSLSESFPNSLLEAMAMEKTIVATAVGAIPEIIRNGEEALIVPPGNSKSLTGAVERLLSDDELVKKLSKRARALVKKKYTWESVARKTLKIYKEILN